MGKNMTSGARRLSGNAVTLLITALLCGGSAALIYSGTASRQISNMLISMACYIVMAVSLNLVVGLLGELSLGHAGFMSVGLFTGCLLSIQLAQSVPIGVRMPLSMLLGGVAAAVVGLLVGLPALRLKGDYLAIVTLACGEDHHQQSLRHRRRQGVGYQRHLRRYPDTAALCHRADFSGGAGDDESEELPPWPGHHGHPG